MFDLSLRPVKRLFLNGRFEDAYRVLSAARLAHYEKQLTKLFTAFDPCSGASSTKPCRRTVFLCFTNRCGSNFLADALFTCGVIPKAREVFNPLAVKSLLEKSGVATFDGFCRELACTESVDGIFSAKVGASQLMLLCKKGAVGNVFADPQFIYMKRNDLLAQSISFEIAYQTKSWTLRQPLLREPRFDRKNIAKRITALSRSNAEFEEFFAFNGIDPYRVIYEDFTQNPQDTIDGIARWLGHPSGQLSIDSLSIRRQADARNAQWKSRFLER